MKHVLLLGTVRKIGNDGNLKAGGYGNLCEVIVVRV